MSGHFLHRLRTVFAICSIVLFSTTATLAYLSDALPTHALMTEPGTIIWSVGERLMLQPSGSYTLYMPFVEKPSVIVPDFFVQNHSFEEGPVLWNEFSTKGEPLIRHATALGVEPYAGEWAAQLGQHDDETAMISQGVTIQSDFACLNYWEWIHSADTCQADYGGMGFNGKWHTVYSLCAGTATGHWVQRQINVSSTITTEQTVTLNFAAVNDYSVPSTLYVDHISLQLTNRCPEKPPAATPSMMTSIEDEEPHTWQHLVGQPILQGTTRTKE